MSDAKPVSTPLAVKHGLSTSQSPSSEIEQNEYSSFSGDIHYLSLVGSLLYATQTHPDIQFSVNRRLPLSPPPRRWPPNPRRLNRLLSPLPKRHVVEISSPLQGLLWPLLTQSMRAFFISVICFPTFLWRRS